MFLYFFVFKQKTAYEMRISDWSSDVCSSDLIGRCARRDSRRLMAQQRRLCRLLREGSRDLREHDRNSRESPKEADSSLPLCSPNVLFVFLQASFAGSR